MNIQRTIARTVKPSGPSEHPDPNKDSETVFKFWGALVILMTCLTFFVFYFFATGTAIILTGAFWGLLFGFSGLVYLPAKIVTAIFGVILGATGSSVITGGGLIASMREAVLDITREILLSGDLVALEGHIQIAVWVFLGLLIILLLPSFILTDENG